MPAPKSSAPEATAPNARPRQWRGDVFGSLLIIIATFVAYIPCLHGGFVWDDDSWTTELAHLTEDVGGLWQIWTNPTAMQQYYPMTGMSFWLDRQLWGFWTTPYHVENILIHALSAILLWRILRHLHVPGAFLSGAVFALHPMMVESVAWITERKNVLSLVFMLGALLAYGRFANWWQDVASRPQRGAYILALVLCALAICSKITAFVFAPTLLLIAWWKRGTLRWGKDVLPTLPFFAMTFALGGLIWWLETYHVGADGKDFSATASERWVTSGRAFWFYPWKLLWPVDLSFIYPDWRASPLTAWDWLWPESAVLAVAMTWFARKWIGRGPIIAVFFYLGALLPVIGFLNVYGGLFAPVWDHWVYVPALGILVLACAGIARLTEKVGQPWALHLVTGVILTLLGIQSWRQAVQYLDRETLWVETIKRNPSAWLAQNNHGSALVTAGKVEEAIPYFEAATKARPHYAEAWNNMGGALVRLGRPDEAIDSYHRAIASRSKITPYIRHNLGNALLMIGRTDEAMEQFRTALAVKPEYEEALNSLGAALTQVGRSDEAIEQLQHALRLKPNYAQAQNNLGSALQKKGDIEAAISAYEKASELDPRLAEARYNLGELLYKKGDLASALSRYQEVVEIDPAHARAHYNLGLCFTNSGKMAEAETAYKRAIEIDPKYASACNNLASNLLKAGRTREAVQYLEKAVEADDQQLAALNNLAWVLATDTDDSLRNGPRAVDFARRASTITKDEHPVVLSTLAAACAEAGQYDEAATQARRALDLASKAGDPGLVSSLEGYVKLYESRQPLRIARKPSS